MPGLLTQGLAAGSARGLVTHGLIGAAGGPPSPGTSGSLVTRGLGGPGLGSLVTRGLGGSSAPNLPASFIAAIGTALVNDATLMGLVGGNVGGGRPNKVWDRLAPPRTAVPWITLLIAGRDRERFAAGQYNTKGMLQITAYATRDTDATAIANRAMIVLQDAADADSIVWSGGPLQDLFDDNANSTKEPELAPLGAGRIWQEIRTFGFVYSGL